MSAPVHAIPIVVTQFAEDAAVLRNLRSLLVVAPHVRVDHLRRLDNRLAAHLDGLQTVGEPAWQLCLASLESPSAARLFVTTVFALRAGNIEGLQQIVALAEALPDESRGVISAFGWLSRGDLQNTVQEMISSRDPFRRVIGIAACAVHRVDPGLKKRNLLDDSDVDVRTRSLRAAAELGYEVALGNCLAALTDDNSDSRFWAAWSAILLGDRGRALTVLRDFARAPQRTRSIESAFRVSLQAMSVGESHEFLSELRSETPDVRRVIVGSGIGGDPSYVPWLISQMRDEVLARIAGESFSLITGADLAWMDLDGPRPEKFPTSPSDDPDDLEVTMDPDDDLPWPDVGKIEKWWASNGSGFQPGTRYFMGKPVTRDHCIDVLKNGYQRQRILAAHYLCLLDPGTPLFNTSAPAWRQQRLLAAM